MTSQNDLQSLIAAIDGVIPNASARLPWLPPSEVASQRRVLEQVRSYLVSLHEEIDESSPSPRAVTSEQEATRQITSVLVQEINSLGASLIQPLQAEISDLSKQREALVQEIRQLETHQQYYENLAQQQAKQQQIISEFLQVLLGSVQESLKQQMAQTLANLEAKFLSYEEEKAAETGVSPGSSERSLSGEPLHPRQRLEQMQQLQGQSDQILITLDSTFQAVFDALQRNIQSNQESLSQRLEKMHNLGQQAEVMFAELISRLASHLPPEASTTHPNSTHTTPDTRQPPPAPNTPKNSPTSAQHPPETGRNFYSQETERGAARQSPPPQQKPNTGRELPYPGTEWLAEAVGAPSKEVEWVNPHPTSRPTPYSPPAVASNPKSIFIQGEDKQPTAQSSVEENHYPETKENPGVRHKDKEETDTSQKRDIHFLAPLPTFDEVFPQRFSDTAEVVEENLLDENTPGFLIAEGRCDELDWLYESVFGASPITVQVGAETSPMENSGEAEEIETIRALTDLFVETAPEESSTPAATAATLEEEVQTPPGQSLLQHQQQAEAISYREQFEDTYIPASPEENLLATDEPASNPHIKIWPQETLIQLLSEDFSSFEAGDTQDVEVREPQQDTAADSVSPPPAPLATEAEKEPQPPQLLDEVLVDDWENHDLNSTP